MDLDRIRTVPRFPAVSVLHKLLRAFLRRRALCAQRRLAPHRRAAASKFVPQLVPAGLSLHLCYVPAGPSMSFAQALDNEFARDVCAGLSRAGQKTLPCRYLYDDVGSALFE